MIKLKITKEERKGLKETFKNFGKPKTGREIFYDLCFCICAPQTTFESNRKVINALINYGFYDCNFYAIKLAELKEMVKPARFYNNKVKYLLKAKKEFRSIRLIVRLWQANKNRLKLKGTLFIRSWLVKNVKGLGMKAASQFLRNLGDTELAIIDTHILKFLNQQLGYYDYPKTISKRYYLELEKDFQQIAKKNKLTTAELDALIWKRYSGIAWKDYKY